MRVLLLDLIDASQPAGHELSITTTEALLQSHSNLPWLLSIMLACHIYLALDQHVELTSCDLKASDESLHWQ